MPRSNLKAGERWVLKWDKGELTFERASKLEWLETNGLGGYAAGTVAGVRTRRYHGLLIASLYPPTQRTLLFAGTDEQVNDGEQVFNLTAHLFPGRHSDRLDAADRVLLGLVSAVALRVAERINHQAGFHASHEQRRRYPILCQFTSPSKVFCPIICRLA